MRLLKKFLKILVIVLSTIFLIVGIILVLALKTVDRTPYYETEYYNTTISNLEDARNSSVKLKGKLYAGFSSLNITPQINAEVEIPLNGQFKDVPMAGYGDRTSPAIGVHDSLFVKAVAIKVQNQMVVILSADLLLIPPFVADSVAFLLNKEIGLTREQLFFGATHTHSGIGASTPGIIGKKFSGEFNPGIISYLSHKFKEAVLLAVEDLKPATISSTEIKLPELVRNRLSKENGRLNDVFTSLCFEQSNGKSAVVGTFAAHSTTLGEDNLEFSGDWPGYFQRKLENELSDVALYFAGTLGSHSHRGEGKDFDRAKHMGESLADKLISHSESIKTDSVTFEYFSIPFEIPEMQFRVKKNLYLTPFISHKLIPPSNNYYLQGMKLNNTIWITCPFELSGEIAIDLKNALKLAGYNSIFTSFNGAYLGYITPSKYYYEESYESYLMGWYGPSMGDYATEMLFKISNELTNKRL